VIVVGGDGSLAEAANGILSVQQPSSVPLGLVGAGNGNDYAWQTLKLPHDPADALEVALAGEVVTMDAGQVNGRFFINSLSIGLDANIAAAAESLKRYPFLKGQMLYQTASMREILFHYDKCPWLKASADEEEVEGKLFALSAVSWGQPMAAAFASIPWPTRAMASLICA
jgi:diacylglycerol kinase (ATP)